MIRIITKTPHLKEHFELFSYILNLNHVTLTDSKLVVPINKETELIFISNPIQSGMLNIELFIQESNDDIMKRFEFYRYKKNADFDLIYLSKNNEILKITILDSLCLSISQHSYSL